MRIIKSKLFRTDKLKTFVTSKSNKNTEICMTWIQKKDDISEKENKSEFLSMGLKKKIDGGAKMLFIDLLGKSLFELASYCV